MALGSTIALGRTTVYLSEQVDEVDLITSLMANYKLEFVDWRHKGGMPNQHYSMKVGIFEYLSERFANLSPTSGKKFEIGITDYEGHYMLCNVPCVRVCVCLCLCAFA